MVRLKSLLTVVVLTVGLVLGSISPIGGQEFDTQTKYAIVKEFVQNGRSHEFLIYDKFNSTTGNSYRFLGAKENTAVQSDFPWTWTIHFLVWEYPGLNVKGPGWFTFEAKDYQEFVTADSRGVLITKIIDKNMDGIIDNQKREFYLVTNENSIMLPIYPKGYINPDWDTLSEEEGNKFLQRELDFWIGVAAEEA